MRTASCADAQSRTAQASRRSTSGTGVARRTTSVRIPSRPSDPSTSWRRSGPAAEAGNGGISSVPAGASSVPPANSCSMRPTPMLRSPAPRAATQPPTVASSHDCGSWPTTRSSGDRWAAEGRPGHRRAYGDQPAPLVDVANTRERGEVDRDHRVGQRPRRDAPDDAGAATPRDDAGAGRARELEQLADLGSACRPRDGVGHGPEPARARRHEVGK